MKKRFLLPLMIASLFTAVSFVSCSDEDDESAFEAAVASAKERNKEKPAENPAPTPPPQPVPQNVTVTFDVNGGTALATSEYTFVEGKSLSNGAGLSALPVTTRAGYEFQNWNTKADGTGSTLSYVGQSINSTVTYYAYWKPLITNVTTSLSGASANYVSLGVGESIVYTFRYEPADATTNWSSVSNSSGVGCAIKDNHDGNVEYTLTGLFARHGIFTITESKSGKAYAIDVTVNAPANSSSIPLITPGTASSTNPADYVGLDKTLDSSTPLLLYRLELEANTAYKFQCASKNYQNSIDVEGLGNCYIWLYNSTFASEIYINSSDYDGFAYRPTTAGTYYLGIRKQSGNTAKGGVHVYKAPTLTGISLSKTYHNFTVGDPALEIEVSFTPSDAYIDWYNNFSFGSSNGSVASIYSWSSGSRKVWITPRATGIARITFKDSISNISATCDVDVFGTNVSNLALSQTSLSINQGESKNLTIIPTPKNASTQYSWYVSYGNSSFGSYDGKVISNITLSDKTFTVTGGVVPGTVTFTVYDDYSGKSASCTITNNTGITASAVTDELPVVGSAASTTFGDYTIVTLNNAQPIKYYKVVVPSSNSGKRYNFQCVDSSNPTIVGNTVTFGDCHFYLFDENFTQLSSAYSGTIQKALNAGTYYFAIVYNWPNETYTYTCRGGVHLYVTD